MNRKVLGKSLKIGRILRKLPDTKAQRRKEKQGKKMNYSIDHSSYPVVVINVTGALSMEDTRSMYDAFDGLLQRPERFAIAMVSNNEERGDPAAQKYMNSWIKAHRSTIGARCAGIAMVTQSSKFIAVYKLIAGQVIRRMYDCPGKLFTDMDEATAWLKGQLKVS